MIPRQLTISKPSQEPGRLAAGWPTPQQRKPLQLKLAESRVAFRPDLAEAPPKGNLDRPVTWRLRLLGPRPSRTIRAFMAAHGLRDVMIVADAGIVSDKNMKAVEAEGLSFILGARLTRVPHVIEAWHQAHPDDQIPDGPILTQSWPAGPTNTRRDRVFYYQYKTTGPAERSRASTSKSPRPKGPSPARSRSSATGSSSSPTPLRP